MFLMLSSQTVKINSSNFKSITTFTIHQNTLCQIFEKSVAILKNFPSTLLEYQVVSVHILYILGIATANYYYTFIHANSFLAKS